MSSEITLHPDVIAAERLGNEIAELSAHIEVAMARLLGLIREFDALGGWANGFKSCAELLSYERVRVARALPTLPLISASFARGEVSYSKVRALTRVATPQTEERLLGFAKNATASHVERLTRAWRRVDRNAENREAEQRHRSRSLLVYQDADGMFVIRGRLIPEVGAVVRQALAAACDRSWAEVHANLPGQDTPTMTQRQADALGMIAEAALHNDLDPGAPGERYQVVVHLDAQVLADPDQPGQSVLEEGVNSSAEESRRIACDASRVALLASPSRGPPRRIPGRTAARWRARVPRSERLGVAARAGVAGTHRHSEDVLRAANDAAGVNVDSAALKSSWDGTRLNLGWAIDVMHPRAIGH